MKNYNIIIIGGGPAGLEAAHQLAKSNYKVCLLEKEDKLGGNLKNWVKLFPDFTDAESINQKLIASAKHPNIEIHTNSQITKLKSDNKTWTVQDSKGEKFEADAVLLATGFTPFDASRKEELGYGIYDNVITSVDFEQMTKDGKILTKQGTSPERIAFLNCVGSRDEKVSNNYCSRLCCINGVKQAIEFKEILPDSEAFVFYMDLRMSGQCYEELYRESQQTHAVNFIRGRISEASATIDNRVQIKAEDTLTGLPLKVTVDILVLMVGMESSKWTSALSSQNGIEGEYGFAKSIGLFGSDNLTEKEGLFLAGTCKKPLTIPESINDARAAVTQIISYMNEKA